jgi:hypothetical protein
VLARLLADQLDITDTGGDPIATAHAVLAARTDPWLVIFDNVARPADLHGMLPPAGPGHVLITSRNPNWAPAERVGIGELTTGPAAQFLLTRTGGTGEADEQAAQGLAEELGGLPLALEQAAAYLQATGGGLRRYLNLYRTQRAELHQRGEPADYPDTVATTWTVAVGHLSPEATVLQRLLACYAPDTIPLRLLTEASAATLDRVDPALRLQLATLAEDPLRLDQAVADLLRYSLLTPSRTGVVAVGGLDDRVVSMHRLVQAVTLDQLPVEEQQRWRHAAGTLLDAALPTDPEDPAGWPTYTLLLPHVLALHAGTDEALRRVASFQQASGNYPAARSLWQQITIDSTTHHGPDHPSTLTAQSNLAGILADLGELQPARRLRPPPGFLRRVLRLLK